MVRTFLTFCVIALCACVAFGAEDFYEQQLQTGKTDFQNNRLPQAADELRIAAFGLLDRPPLLEEALVRLAVAQEMLSRTSDLSHTIDRFLEVEQKFTPYPSLPIEPQIKAAFEKILFTTVPRATLQSIPTLAPITNYELRKVASLPEDKRIAAYRAGAQREPQNPDWPLALAREYAARDNSGEVIRWTTATLKIDPANKDARALAAHARSQRRECREALGLITDAEAKEQPALYADETYCLAQLGRFKEAQAALANVPPALRQRADVKEASDAISRAIGNKPAASPQTQTRAPQSATAAPAPAPPSPAETLELTRRLIHDGKADEALDRLRAAVQTTPSNRQLRLALIEAAVLSKDWKTAASQVPAVTPFVTGEELYMFYSSVALYETGQKDDARPLMQRARGHMVPSPFVNYYVKTVLGDNG